MPPLFTPFSLASSFWYSGQDWVATPCHSAMADSSIVTLGPGRSLLVDSSVYDSRMAETSKEQFFMGLHTDETEGKWTALHLDQPYIHWHFCRVDGFTEHKPNKRGYFLPLNFVYFHRDSPLPVVFCNPFFRCIAQSWDQSGVGGGGRQHGRTWESSSGTEEEIWPFI